MRPAISRWGPFWRRRDHCIPLTFAAIGFAPIACLALALAGVVPLPVSTLAVVLPAALGAVVLAGTVPTYGIPALRGFAIGLLAVLAYDGTRLPAILSGRWADFIPNIGALMLQREEGHAVVGYAWRWLGNGAGMGMAFVMLYPLVSRRVGVLPASLLFGVGVWGCLLVTLLAAPEAQTLLFRLTPLTVVISLLGHLVFGGTLALGMAWMNVNMTPYRPDPTGAGVGAARVTSTPS